MKNEQITQTSSYFIVAVETFFQQGWMALGKIPNPFDGKTDRNLKLAEYSINILEALQGKTKGNLNKEESKLITEQITLLKSNYIVELNKPDEAAKGSEIKEDKPKSDD